MYDGDGAVARLQGDARPLPAKLPLVGVVDLGDGDDGSVAFRVAESSRESRIVGSRDESLNKNMKNCNIISFRWGAVAQKNLRACSTTFEKIRFLNGTWN